MFDILCGEENDMIHGHSKHGLDYDKMQKVEKYDGYEHILAAVGRYVRL